MASTRRSALLSRVSLLGCAAVLATGLASAQSVRSQASATDTWSSSQSGTYLLADGAAPASAALPSAPTPAAAQDNNSDTTDTYSGWSGHDILHRLTIEAGGGIAGPAGDKQYVTYGGQFTVGGGVNINQNLAMLIEYQFIDNKMPGHIIAEAGAQSGRYHIWSFTVAPVYDIWPKNSNDLYVTGGGGFYRKVTNFSNPTLTYGCFYYYYCGPQQTNQVVGHFSSNQGGWNIGGGYQHRFQGMYGESKFRLYAEVRYLDVLSPKIAAAPGGTGSGANLSPVNIGAGTRELPITLGVRW